jgi:hypothetical protein
MHLVLTGTNNKKKILIILKKKKKKKLAEKQTKNKEPKNLAFSLRLKVYENRNKKIKNIFDFFSFSKKLKKIIFSFLPIFLSSQNVWRFILWACLHRKQKMIIIIYSEGWVMH